jgi:hypothetical protein
MPDMIRQNIPGLGYHSVTIVERITSMPPSRAPGEVLPKGGFWLI